jgi:hypothetical protein
VPSAPATRQPQPDESPVPPVSDEPSFEAAASTALPPSSDVGPPSGVTTDATQVFWLQTSPAFGHDPHWSIPPHESAIAPHCAFATAQVVGTQVPASFFGPASTGPAS